MTERTLTSDPYVNLLTDLAADEQISQLVRHRVITKARLFVAAGVRPAVVAKVLGISERTLYRRFAEAAALEGDEEGELSATVASVALQDQARAEAEDVQ